MAAGRIAERLQLPSATLSFHLAQLKQAGLISCRREGRSLIYAVDFGAMSDLMAYLTDNCCGGSPEACGIGVAARQASVQAADRQRTGR